MTYNLITRFTYSFLLYSLLSKVYRYTQCNAYPYNNNNNNDDETFSMKKSIVFKNIRCRLGNNYNKLNFYILNLFA